jgi:hypothetical protein
MSAEKWLPIYEVREKELYNYLVLQKNLGYKLIGLEQTSQSS